MIKITIYRNSERNYKEIKVSGHAGYSEYGTDIICSSISVLIINTINAVERFTEDKFQVESDEDTGLIDFKLLHTPSKETTLLLDTLVLGVTDIASEYGTDFVTVIFKEV